MVGVCWRDYALVHLSIIFLSINLTIIFYNSIKYNF